MLRHANRLAGLLHSSWISRSGQHRRSRIRFGQGITDKEKADSIPQRSALTVKRYAEIFGSPVPTRLCDLAFGVFNHLHYEPCFGRPQTHLPR